MPSIWALVSFLLHDARGMSVWIVCVSAWFSFVVTRNMMRTWFCVLICVWCSLFRSHTTCLRRTYVSQSLRVCLSLCGVLECNLRCVCSACSCMSPFYCYTGVCVLCVRPFSCGFPFCYTKTYQRRCGRLGCSSVVLNFAIRMLYVRRLYTGLCALLFSVFDVFCRAACVFSCASLFVTHACVVVCV